jgi:hypothetical protein
MTRARQGERPTDAQARAERAPLSRDEPPPTAPAASLCPPRGDEATCPACGATMRLWANYYRCRTCGFKESCCF